ncbi:MAG: LysR substrate-binding domain-containing protein [Shimia sp.]
MPPPSLTLLRAFEAAARLGSLSAAARELNVTHAAVAQNVKRLEAELGQSLLVRAGAGMQPTEVGAALAQRLTEGFGIVAAGIRAVEDLTRSRPVAVTCTPTFAEHWLMPRIGNFWAKHPEIEVSITPSTQVVDLVRDGYDLAIRYGRGPWPGVDAQGLMLGEPLIVAARHWVTDPALNDPTMTDAKRAALTALPWMMDTSFREYWSWLEALGLRTEAFRITRFVTNHLVLAATREGMGASVQPRPLVSRELATGALVALHAEEAGPRQPLDWLLTPKNAPIRPDVATFVKWLRRTAAAEATR